MATGAPTKHIQQCDVANVALFPPGGRTCLHAFQSNDGTRVPFDEVKIEIEEGLGKALELRPHLVDYKKQYQPDPKRWTQHQRYRLYLVALRPTVVVGVPESKYDSCGAPGGTECFTVLDPKGRSGYSFSGWSAGVYYAKSPPVLPGSFIFVPKSGLESTPLSESSARVAIPLSTSALVNMGGYWKLQP